MKTRRSITIDSELEKNIEKQAKKETRNFSNMIAEMAKKYLTALVIKQKGDQ